MATKSRESSLTNMRAWIVGASVGAVGLVVVVVSAWLPWLQEDPQMWLRNVLSQLGSLVLISGAVAVYWDLRGKRDMIDEVLVRVRTSEQIVAAGITNVTTDYQSLEWRERFETSTTFDLFIVYGHTWRGSNWKYLQDFAADPRKSIRVFLPDPRDLATVAVLADRFDYTPERVKRQIEEMARDMATLLEDHGADLRIYYRVGDPTYTLYKFDRSAVVTMYSNSRKRGDVPAIAVTRGTFLAFFDSEISAIERQSTPVSIEELLGSTR